MIMKDYEYFPRSIEIMIFREDILFIYAPDNDLSCF